MLNIISSWKFKDIHKSKKEPDVFYILQNEMGEYYNRTSGARNDIKEATRYSSVGTLKASIFRTYYPKNKMILTWNKDNSMFEKFSLPEDAFDNCNILKMKEV